jgi:plasmid stabilization system protein ParE
MKRYTVRFTEEAEADLGRLYEFLVERDVDAAVGALAAIREAIRVLRFTPHSCRRASREAPALRELVIPFGKAGYVVLFEVESKYVTILAARHQREDDYE